MQNERMIVRTDAPVLVTGANGFIGTYVVRELLRSGFRNLRCLVRPSGDAARLREAAAEYPAAQVEILTGNLLNPDDCLRSTDSVRVIYHLATGRDKSFADCFLNSVVTTRNLLDAALANARLVRFVSISSFAVYSTGRLKRGALLDERCPVEERPQERYEPYVYAKVKQDELVRSYGERYDLPYVILRPGNVFGPEKKELTGRIGIDTFGLFLHLGGANRIPFTYVENCAEAIVLAGLVPGIEGETFNIVDDDVPKSSKFLKMYKRHVRSFRSVRVPYRLFYLFCGLWEWYSRRSENLLPPVFNRRRCSAYWGGNRYTNEKLKRVLGWKPRVPFGEALERYFHSVEKAVHP